MFQQVALALAAPVIAVAFSVGPPINRTGAPTDGGLNCAACHRTFAPANTGPGKVSIAAVTYTPGTKQNLTITVEDPQATKWGFQLTARLRSDETKEAGVFTPVDGRIRVVCDPDGRAAPCDGAREFATHVAASTQVGTTGKGSFVVEWTPPTTDVGEVIFYFAGNAANNSSTNAGDYIYTSSAVIRPVCSLTAKPTVTNITDAASYRTSISSGALVTVFGTGMSSSKGAFAAYANDLAGGKLDTKLGCIAVEIGGKRAPVFSLTSTQVSVQAPAIDVAGPVNVVVIANPGATNELRSDAKTVDVKAVTPAFFLIDSKTIAGRNASKDLRILGAEVPAAPGDIVTLYATGCGATTPAWGAGEFPDKASPLAATPTITIGGVTLQAADILYAGASSDAPGLYQFNLKVPASLPDGDAAVKISSGGNSTQDGAIIPIKK